MKRVIVTGASGFIGQHLVRALLDEGVEVWAVLRNEKALEDLKRDTLHIVTAEFDEYASLSEKIPERGFDACFHLAWSGTWGKPFADYTLQLQNAKYAADTVVQAAALGCGRFVMVSTIVQLEAQRYMLSDEGTPRISCIYGTAKSAATMLCRIESEHLGIEWNTAVLSSVYGVGDRSKMIENVLIESFMAGQRPRLVEGNNHYDCTYVDDIARGLITIVEKGRGGRTYYVGHRQLQTFREIVGQIRDVLAPDMELVFGEYPDTTPIDYSLLDVGALYKDTGFEPSVSLRDGIQATARWMLQQK